MAYNVLLEELVTGPFQVFYKLPSTLILQGVDLIGDLSHLSQVVYQVIKNEIYFHCSMQLGYGRMCVERCSMPLEFSKYFKILNKEGKHLVTHTIVKSNLTL